MLKELDYENTDLDPESPRRRISEEQKKKKKKKVVDK